jgi:transcription initiation factor TFIID subunit TAF12
MALPVLYLAAVEPEAPAYLTLAMEAHAVVGAPLTPASAAGVARRTTRRVAVASTSTTAQQQSATAQQQSAAAQQQTAAAQQQTAASARPPGAPAAGVVVTALPAGCKPETRSGVEYQNCGGVYYRAAFQGENLVYVVQ